MLTNTGIKPHHSGDYLDYLLKDHTPQLQQGKFTYSCCGRLAQEGINQWPQEASCPVCVAKVSFIGVGGYRTYERDGDGWRDDAAWWSEVLDPKTFPSTRDLLNYIHIGRHQEWFRLFKQVCAEITDTKSNWCNLNDYANYKKLKENKNRGQEWEYKAVALLEKLLIIEPQLIGEQTKVKPYKVTHKKDVNWSLQAYYDAHMQLLSLLNQYTVFTQAPLDAKITVVELSEDALLLLDEMDIRESFLWVILSNQQKINQVLFNTMQTVIEHMRRAGMELIG